MYLSISYSLEIGGSAANVDSSNDSTVRTVLQDLEAMH